MARPRISLLLLSLVLVAIDAHEPIPNKNEDCPKNNVCLLWTKVSCNSYLRNGVAGRGTAVGYLWGEGSTCKNNNKFVPGFTASLWIEPLSARKWKIAARLWIAKSDERDNKYDETDYEFDFGKAKIGFIKNAAKKDMTEYLMQFSWKKTEDGEWSSSTYPLEFGGSYGGDDPAPNKEFTYPKYISVVESAEKLITLFGDVDQIKLKGSGSVITRDVPRFNERLHELELCDPSELRSFEFVNAVNGTLPIYAGNAADCPHPYKMWYRKAGGGWEPVNSMFCKYGAWQGQYSPKIKVTTTVAPTEEDEGEDDPNAQGLRAARSIDNEEDSEDEKFEYGPLEKYDLTGTDVACGKNPPQDASPKSAGMKIGMTIGIIFVVLAIVALIIGAVIFVLRRKRAAAGPNDTFRAGSESKAQTPKGGSMSKKSGSVVEIGGMSPAGTPNAPK